jgi:NAD(P)-dependent dehydrogenase (short-subunit alcohol dehydrogenase family)
MTDEEAWDKVMAINLKSVLLMTKAALPLIIQRGGGSVINISSVAGIHSYGGIGTAYSSSKAGMIMLTRDIAVGYGRNGIRANAIAPGHIWTPMIAGTTSPEAREQRRKAAPLGTEGNAWDVAWTAVFLASDEARFISGVCIPVDGGLTQTAPLKAHSLLSE